MRENPFTMVYRWFLFVILSIGCPLLSGCGNTSPSDTVKSVLMKANDGLYSEANQHLSPEIQKLREQLKMSPKMFWDSITQNGKISKVEILNEETRGEGAKVKLKIHYQDGKVVESEEELIKENGKWKIQFGKTFTAIIADPIKPKTARAQMTVLEKAVKTFQLDYGVPPTQLQDLFVQGPKGGPYLEEQRALKDPWGVEYKYDPNGARNHQMGKVKVDIWSEGSGTIIGNWE